MKFLFTAITFIFSSFCYSQKVFSVKYSSEAQVKVYVVKYESEADLKVYKTTSQSEADKNQGIWYFTDYNSQADKKIYFVDYSSQADLKICFVNYKSQAGWRNKEKIHLMY